MTLHQYNRLHKEQQLDSLWSEGFIIGERQNERYSFILYRIDTFYVELRYYHKFLHGFQVYGNKKQLASYNKKSSPYTSTPRLYTRSLYQIFYMVICQNRA